MTVCHIKKKKFRPLNARGSKKHKQIIFTIKIKQRYGNKKKI